MDTGKILFYAMLVIFTCFILKQSCKCKEGYDEGCNSNDVDDFKNNCSVTEDNPHPEYTYDCCYVLNNTNLINMPLNKLVECGVDTVEMLNKHKFCRDYPPILGDGWCEGEYVGAANGIPRSCVIFGTADSCESGEQGYEGCTWHVWNPYGYCSESIKNSNKSRVCAKKGARSECESEEGCTWLDW
jgi:hypothetical protein